MSTIGCRCGRQRCRRAARSTSRGKTARSPMTRTTMPFPRSSSTTNAGLADRLWAARETAESVKAGEGRTRAALYKALSLAYDFAIAAQTNPDEYAELLEESGVKAQARAPMTPIVKLVFGIDYDKARLTEFAAALVLRPAPGRRARRRSRTSSRSSRAASRRWSPPSARRAGPSRSRTPRARSPARSLRVCAADLARRRAGGRGVRGRRHPPRRRRHA